MGKKDKSKTPGDKKPITDDARFASVHSDPRFKLPNLKNFKVKVDERFSKKELEKLNAGSSGKKATIDRYGRKIQDKKSDIDKYYEHESDSEEESKSSEDEKAEVKSASEDEDSDLSASEKDEIDSEDEDKEEKIQTSALDRARGEGVGSDESSSDSDSDSDSDSSVNFEEESESEIEIEEGKPEDGDPTSSFAVVNMDWDNLRAVDLMATFVSFVPKGGLIKSVTIYPSEFGKEQMQKEETSGPPRELFKKKHKKKSKDDSDIEDDIDTSNPADLEKAARQLYEEEDAEDYDSKALRRYQLQRLRYYYAVVRCDSVQTAKAIYDNCDGTEFESTANIFDLRYVPEEMDFDDGEAKEACTKIPSNYKPGATFITDALQHSKVKLTWDETPKERLALATRLFSQKELDDMDFKAYLASDSDDSEIEESAKNKYKNLISSSFKFDGKDKAEDDDDVDMEITFNPGLDDKPVEEKAAKEGDEDTISAYKRKQKERRKNRLEKLKQLKEVEKQGSREETRDKKKNSKQGENIDAKSQAELELLMMDENDEKPDNHFNMKEIIKAEKRKGKKGKKGKTSDEATDDFKIDLDDERFKEVFEDHDYAIDPTSTDFKKTSTVKKILEERSKRAGKRKHSKDHKAAKKAKSDGSTPEVKSLVEKLKKRHGSK